MSTRSRTALFDMPSPAFVMLLIFMIFLFVAGGSARADVMGQAVVRGIAALALAGVTLLAPTPRFQDAKPVLYLMIATIAIVLLQLVPLPPGVWHTLPGRAIFEQAVSGEQPWRPLSIVPDLTLNAAASLLVPLAILVLAVSLRPTERNHLPAFVLALIFASMLTAVLQFSGSRIDNPLINDDAVSVSGSFANRNHFALFLALGCLAAPLWPFLHNYRAPWRGPVALGLVVLFLLGILASGSRAGMLVGGLALVLGLLLAQHGIRRALRHAPRWTFPAFIAAIVATLGIFVFISVSANRAESISRVMTLDAGADVRAHALPTVLSMIQVYFPAGSGFGGFDPIFRLHEPFALLKPTYFNHAHDDLLEVLLDGGLPALVLLVIALSWWLRASIRVWRAPAEPQILLGRMGSVMLLLIVIASVVDYPARTPMIMAMIVLAALWLSWASATPNRATLPGDK